jgi:hypothetical protein
MRRVALAGALAAVAAVGVVGGLAWSSGGSVEARVPPYAALQLHQLWSTAPRATFRFPAVLHHFDGWRQADTRRVLDTRLPAGRLTLYAARDARGVTCYYESADVAAAAASCLSSFNGVPGRLMTLSASGGWNLMVGLLRDGTSGVDLQLNGRWQPARVQGRGVYLTSHGESLGRAIERVRYHLADGSTVVCDRWDSC